MLLTDRSDADGSHSLLWSSFVKEASLMSLAVTCSHAHAAHYFVTEHPFLLDGKSMEISGYQIVARLLLQPRISRRLGHMIKLVLSRAALFHSAHNFREAALDLRDLERRAMAESPSQAPSTSKNLATTITSYYSDLVALGARVMSTLSELRTHLEFVCFNIAERPFARSVHAPSLNVLSRDTGYANFDVDANDKEADDDSSLNLIEDLQRTMNDANSDDQDVADVTAAPPSSDPNARSLRPRLPTFAENYLSSLQTPSHLFLVLQHLPRRHAAFITVDDATVSPILDRQSHEISVNATAVLLLLMRTRRGLPLLTQDLRALRSYLGALAPKLVQDTPLSRPASDVTVPDVDGSQLPAELCACDGVADVNAVVADMMCDIPSFLVRTIFASLSAAGCTRAHLLLVVQSCVQDNQWVSGFTLSRLLVRHLQATVLVHNLKTSEKGTGKITQLSSSFLLALTCLCVGLIFIFCQMCTWPCCICFRYLYLPPRMRKSCRGRCFISMLFRLCWACWSLLPLPFIPAHRFRARRLLSWRWMNPVPRLQNLFPSKSAHPLPRTRVLRRLLLLQPLLLMHSMVLLSCRPCSIANTSLWLRCICHRNYPPSLRKFPPRKRVPMFAHSFRLARHHSDRLLCFVKEEWMA